MQSWTLLGVVGSLTQSDTNAVPSLGGSFTDRSVMTHFTELKYGIAEKLIGSKQALLLLRQIFKLAE